MTSQAFHALQAERGRRGGLAAAKRRKEAKASEAKFLDQQWPKCGDCGSRMHMGLCPVCDN